LRVLTAGESHGPAIIAIVDSVPAGLPLTTADIDRDLARRQAGHGRGGRMKIEKDSARFLSGVRHGLTMGSPVTLYIENRDHANWESAMSPEAGAEPEKETKPRPGHGDLAGMLKYSTGDARNILERASARETAARVAAGAVGRRLLEEIGVTVRSRVVSVGSARDKSRRGLKETDFLRADEDEMRCLDPDVSAAMMSQVDEASEQGDTLGGTFEVAVFGAPPGLGSHAQADRRLDAILCAALVSIPGVKGSEVGDGFSLGGMRGSKAHDEIFYDKKLLLHRRTNHAGGIEAGMSNGETIILRAAMKPIPTLGKPLATVDLADLSAARAFKERADVCAVPAASVVGEAVVALALASAAQEKFGGDSLAEMRRNAGGYLEQISAWWSPRGDA
jgi:chorismate synthase